MTDEEIIARIEATRPRRADFDMNKVILLIIGAVMSLLGSLLLAVAGFYVIGTLQKSDESAISIATFTQRMGSMEIAISTLTTTVTELRKEVQNSRLDPFTGADGKRLEERIEEDRAEEITKLEERDRDFDHRIRELERPSK